MERYKSKFKRDDHWRYKSLEDLKQDIVGRTIVDIKDSDVSTCSLVFILDNGDELHATECGDDMSYIDWSLYNNPVR